MFCKGQAQIKSKLSYCMTDPLTSFNSCCSNSNSKIDWILCIKLQIKFRNDLIKVFFVSNNFIGHFLSVFQFYWFMPYKSPSPCPLETLTSKFLTFNQENKLDRSQQIHHKTNLCNLLPKSQKLLNNFVLFMLHNVVNL